jgi:SWI/SNF-related matrix-associated actin-dependent regulator 1 of chromatin subfamily A
VICPASLVFNWKKEIEAWSTIENVKVEIFNSKTFSAKRFFHYLIFPYSFASTQGPIELIKSIGPFDLMVLDESHFLKNPKAKRTKYILARNGLVGSAKEIHALSGTPIVNRPIELYPILKALCPQAIDNMDFFSYGMKYCAGFKQNIGGGRSVWNFDGASNLNILATRLRSHFMVRRKKEKVLEDLPEKREALVYLEPTKKVSGINFTLAPFLKDRETFKNAQTVSFEELSEARRVLGIEKIIPASEYIKTQIDAGNDKIIVFAHHKEVISGLREKLKELRPVVISGETSKEDRQKAVELFQTDESRKVFIGSIGAASVGLTLTASSYVVFVEFSWVPGENEQAIDRAHRIGQKNSVLAEYLVFQGSIDERILESVSEKWTNIQTFNN